MGHLRKSLFWVPGAARVAGKVWCPTKTGITNTTRMRASTARAGIALLTCAAHGNGIDPQGAGLSAGASDTDLPIAQPPWRDQPGLLQDCPGCPLIFRPVLARVRSSSFAVDDPVLGKEGFAGRSHHASVLRNRSPPSVSSSRIPGSALQVRAPFAGGRPPWLQRGARAGLPGRRRSGARAHARAGHAHRRGDLPPPFHGRARPASCAATGPRA